MTLDTDLEREVRELRHTILTLRDHAIGAEAQVAQSEKRTQEATRLQSAAEARAAEAELRRAEAEAAVRADARRAAEAEVQRDEAERGRREAQLERDGFQRELTQIRASRSWRLARFASSAAAKLRGTPGSTK
ncbi:hypothetical protein [Jatrophihabitans sp. GAS493]|uniref:hypothetical protein n=1 Tax=Jatrophihabitans sp. GAS493 TaxID=1907575 RepID=UPI0012FD05A2|nr:hypothetical protein [Jatrophihabitans sp. GAS493]